MGWLEGNVALVTGGGSGLGRAIVERYLAEGASVGVLELVPEKCAALREELGDGVVVVEGDVSQYEANARAVEATVDAFGKLDTFVGNAGIFDGMLSVVDIEPGKLGAGFDEMYAVNVKGCLYGVKAAIPHLLKTEGAIILTASFASFYPAGGGILYTSSKHAVLGLIRQLAYELGPKIRVYGVAPGAVQTQMRGVAALGQTTMPSLQPGNEKRIPVQFLPEPADYAGSYVFLASKENSRVMTGITVNAYNGFDVRGIQDPIGGLNL
jgi:NAD(P)-dependent dehydrogenase (short-subunit alcohol dehydrogenase family)